MELLGFHGTHWTPSTHLLIVSVCYLTLGTCTAKTPTTLTISQIGVTRVNGTSEVRCDIDKRRSPDGFLWLHTDANNVLHVYDFISEPGVTITGDSHLTFSKLTIEHLTATDSGQISCQYFHYPNDDEDAGIFLSKTINLCVSDIPEEPPKCSYSFANDEVTFHCTVSNICPSEVTLEWQQLSTSNLYVGNSTSNVSHAENVLTLQSTDLENGEEFICKFKSESYPDMSLNCTISAYETPSTVINAYVAQTTATAHLSATETATSSILEMNEVSTILPVTTMTTELQPAPIKPVSETTIRNIPTTSNPINPELEPETFSLTHILIVACAVGIYALLLLFGCYIINTCLRKRKRGEVKSEMETTEIRPSYTEVDMTDIQEKTYIKLKPVLETTSADKYQFHVNETTDDQELQEDYVNDWRAKEIQSKRKRVSHHVDGTLTI